MTFALAASCATSRQDTDLDDASAGGSGGLSAGGNSSTGGSANNGSGGTGASSSMATTGGAGGVGGAGGSGGSEPSLCGNGMVDPGEACDGTDFGGKTCVSLGLGGGELLCNPYCAFVVSNCTPKESCANGLDDDKDGDIDCQDSECAMAPACLDSCASVTPLMLPGFNFGDTTGKADVHAASCSGTSGPESFFSVTPPFTGDLGIMVSSMTDFSISVRSTCGDANSELVCNNYKSKGLLPETLAFPVVQGTTYYVMIDGVKDADFGYFDLQAMQTAQEAVCENLVDDDFDAYMDCDDPTDCKGTAKCATGSKTVGEACTKNADCNANAGDPICLPDSMGYAGGYCSEFCNLANDDCGSGALCYADELSVNGLCLDKCTDNNDCRTGYACLNLGLSGTVCHIAPESNCNDAIDNDFDLLIDCQDPTDCQTLPACTPGPGVVGAPCTANSQCAATGNDPLCLDALNYGWPSGYCSEFCNIAMNDCAMGSSCVDWLLWPNGDGNCLKDCKTPNDCSPGYSCIMLNNNKMVCVY